ncbi:hypothetical protein INR75_00750 [Zunongwangia sp. SCSIO 43204]|uniref:hypothetical protein n=1 Tax=Zunongwangia sp. SCSIO 43204 TaxID=2779359 RepID=UPI001CA874E5|nr:hypothetical protein [Zunongwangia sp. SCSIO 43204]UAB84600.1 hypothetical protein INR75_00750 [Zunongwangia sp. SCSIO 43204]
MKTIIIYFAFLISSFAIGSMEAQETTTEKEEHTTDSIARVQEIKERKIKIATEEEKAKLKKEIEYINKSLENGWCDEEEAEKRKKEAAKLAAENIKNRIVIITNQVDMDERNRHDGKYLELKLTDGRLGLGIEESDDYKRSQKRTTNDLVLAFGFNNALESGQSINNSDFKLAGSRFFEIGWAWTTRVFENTNWLRMKYGLSFQINGLKLTDNRYFVQDGDITRLEEFEYDLDKSKFRMDNLVVPIHFEIGPSSRGETNGYRTFSTDDQIKIGFGGYAGFNIGERQKLKFNDGDDQKIKDKSSFNTNEFVYGLSAYLSFGGTALYAKYDLNPIFASPNTELNNFSLGLRFDVD